LALQGRITLDTKLVVTVGDLAFLSNTWSLTGTGPDGTPLTMGATTAEVARRQADGTWRYVIDNVWGIREPPDEWRPGTDAVDIVIIGAGAGAKLIWGSVPGRSVAVSSRSSWAGTARSMRACRARRCCGAQAS
jgi:hypothetical protein